MWLSLVERSVRDREVGGSNPPTPTSTAGARALPSPLGPCAIAPAERLPSRLRPCAVAPPHACPRETYNRRRGRSHLRVTPRIASSGRIFIERHDRRLRTPVVDVEQRDGPRTPDTGPPSGPRIDVQHTSPVFDHRPVRVTRRDHGNTFGHDVVMAEEIGQDVAHQDAQAANLHEDFFRQRLAQRPRVHVAPYGAHWGDQAELFEHSLIAHVAGVQDTFHTSEDRTNFRIETPMRVGDEANFTHRVDRLANMRGLANKRVVVTGGTSGIGAATVARLREEGCVVFSLARRQAPDSIRCDVGEPDQVQAALEQIVAQSGVPDVVINNAGTSLRHLALDITPVEWDQVMKTNLTGVFNVAQTFGRAMHAGQGGVIINVASTNALVGHPFYADYNASKAGVLALTRTLALEWAPHVRVNAVCPGYVLTPMQEAEYTPEMLATVNAKIPLGRHARPDEIAALLAFLASDECAYMTGSAVVIDGGETAGGLASR